MTPRRQGRDTLVLYLAFFLSGLAGLIYETIWSRYLSLLLGHSAYAQVTVLVIFLGGLSAGAFLAGHVSERLRKPLLWYVGVEVVVGVLGLFFHDLFGVASDFTYGTLVPALAGGGTLTAARWTVAGLLILPQSVLLGTTFPLMSAAVLRRLPTRPGHVLALLYFTNSLGAALGGLVSGFYLIALAGLPGALVAAAVLNLVVALMAYVVETWGSEPEVEAAGASPLATQPGEGRAGVLPSTGVLWRWLLGVSFGTAVASFIYEIAWIRMLSLVLGSATHSFELMLSAFILGLALGALWIRRRADHLTDPLRMLAEIQWVMGFTALATLPIYLLSFDLIGGLLDVLQRTDSGYLFFNLARYGVALAVMLPSTFCAGMTLPLITRLLVVSGKGERAVGWVYGINTLGSIVGVAAAALLLLPLLGLKWLLVLGAVLDMGLGIAILFVGARDRRGAGRRLAYGALVVTPLVAVGIGWAASLDRAVLTSGVYRTGRVPAPEVWDVLYYADGRTASVGVVQQRDTRWIATNGKPDASLRTLFLEASGPLGDPDPGDVREGRDAQEPMTLQGDESTQVLLTVIPLAHNPDARRAAVVGQGSGVTSHVLLGSPTVERVTTIDIEPRMIDGSRFFYPANRRVFDDPRSHFLVDDARTALGFGGERYDLIVSEPSNPWVSGTASLFTSEFYARVTDRLAPGGIFAQWVQVYEISDELVLTILAALHENFPSYEVFRTRGDLVIVAGLDDQLPRPDWSVVEMEGIAEDLDGVHPLDPVFMEVGRIATREGLAPLVERWAANSDFFPLLDLEADRARFIARAAGGFATIGQQPVDPASMLLPPIRELAGPRSPVSNVRMQALALNRRLRDALEDPTAYDLEEDRALAAALHRTRRFLRLLELGEPPGDWREWVDDAIEVLDGLQGGLLGEAYEPLYPRLYAYMEDAGAPPEAFAAIRFTHGMAARAWPELAEASRELAGPTLRGDHWITPDVLRDGGTLSLLAVGDVERARVLFDALTSHVERPPEDLRTRLLGAHLLEAEEAGQILELVPDTAISTP